MTRAARLVLCLAAMLPPASAAAMPSPMACQDRTSACAAISDGVQRQTCQLNARSALQACLASTRNLQRAQVRQAPVMAIRQHAPPAARAPHS